MIIVSQDKKEIVNFSYGFCLSILTGATKQIITIDGHKIGEYKTEERAKEILEEIIKAYTGHVAIVFNNPMGFTEQKVKAKFYKAMQKDTNMIVADNGAKIESLPHNPVYYMPEE